jgi:hypothetical protein
VGQAETHRDGRVGFPNRPLDDLGALLISLKSPEINSVDFKVFAFAKTLDAALAAEVASAYWSAL